MNKLAQLLGLQQSPNMMPSPARSQLVQMLQAQSARPAFSTSPLESASIASKPIVAALLARKEQQGQQNVSARQQAALGALMRSQQQGPQGQAASQALSTILSGLPPDNPVASSIAGAQIAQSLPRTDQRRVHSAQILANGNIGYLDAFSGQVIDTGTKASDSFQVLSTPGGGAIPVSRRSGEPSKPIITSEEGTSEAAARTGAETTAREEAQQNAQLRLELPQEYSRIGEELLRNEQMLERLSAGEFETGPIVGLMPAVTTAQQEFQVFSGEDVVSKISSATFGQLSEGEREFLRTTVPSRDKTEEANRRIIQRRIEILKRTRDRLESRMKGAGVELTEPSRQSAPTETDVTKMTDEELKRLIGGE